jgi:hypothetical protein
MEMPDMEGNTSERRVSIRSMLPIPGVAVILVAVFAWLLSPVLCTAPP